MQKLLPVVALGLAFSSVAWSQLAETTANSSHRDGGHPPPAVLPSPISPSSVGFNNGSLVNSPGTGAGGADESLLQDSTLGMGVFGFSHSTTSTFRVADDFTVPAGGWNISQITFYAYQTGSTTTSTITSVTLRIWNGVPGAPGSSIVFGDTTTNRLASTGWSGIYRGLLSAPGATNRPIMANVASVNTTLSPGTYWLDWATGGSAASGPWAPPVTVTGQSTTGNAIQFDGTTWNALADVGPQGLPFIIEIADPPAAVSTLGFEALLLLGSLFGFIGLAVVARRS